MIHVQYTIIRIVASLVLCVSGLINWRIYYKHRGTSREYVSALDQIRRLLAERNRDGYIAVVSNTSTLLAGITLLILIYVRG